MAGVGRVPAFNILQDCQDMEPVEGKVVYRDPKSGRKIKIHMEKPKKGLLKSLKNPFKKSKTGSPVDEPECLPPPIPPRRQDVLSMLEEEDAYQRLVFDTRMCVDPQAERQGNQERVDIGDCIRLPAGHHSLEHQLPRRIPIPRPICPRTFADPVSLLYGDMHLQAAHPQGEAMSPDKEEPGDTYESVCSESEYYIEDWAEPGHDSCRSFYSEYTADSLEFNPSQEFEENYKKLCEDYQNMREATCNGVCKPRKMAQSPDENRGCEVSGPDYWNTGI